MKKKRIALNKETTAPLIKNKMKELGFFPKKFLGQCFLINPQIIEKTILKVESLKQQRSGHLLKAI